MYRRLLLLTVLLSSLLLFSACGKMSDEKAIAAMKESDELWINYGLAAWEQETEPADVTYILDDAHYFLYLHNYIFSVDEEYATLVAEDFFRFVAEKHGLAAILDTDKRVAYKTEYLRALGYDFDYSRSGEEEAFFRDIDFGSDEEYSFLFTYKNAKFSFHDLSSVKPPEMQTMLMDTCAFIDGFAELVRKEKIGDYFDPEREVMFHCEDIGKKRGTSYAQTSGYIYMLSTTSLTHEYVHAVSRFSYGRSGANTMLSEVVATYFPSLEGLDAMPRKNYYNRFNAAPVSYYDGLIAQGGAAADQARYWKCLIESYEALGGKYESYADIDLTLAEHANAITGQMSGSSVCVPFSVTYGDRGPFDGDDLLGDETGSFGKWLIEEYGLIPVLETWKTNDFYGTLGKDYVTIKAEWLDFFAQYQKLAADKLQAEK